MTMHQFLRATSLVACLLLATSFASAGDKALAETLFVEGRKLMAAGKHADACPKFEASNREDPSAGTLMNLAICYEKTGRTATAWATYKETVVRAGTEGRTQHEDAARDAAARLEPKLSKLTITVPASAPEGLVVERDATVLSASAFGVPVAVDPGEHSIKASAPGYEPWSTTIAVQANADSKTVTIPALTALPEATPPPTDTPAPASPPPSEPTPASATPPAGSTDATRDSSSGSSTLGWVLTGAGTAVLGTGFVFGYLASQQASDAESDPNLCPDKRCTPAGRSEIDGAESKALISTIGVGVGAVALGAGVYFLVSAGGSSAKASPKASSARVSPFVAAGGGGVGVSGAF